MRYDDVCISSGHSLLVQGANSIVNEVKEARLVTDKVAEYLKSMGCDVDKFHDNLSDDQRENINRIVTFHDSKHRKLDISVHFNAFKKNNNPVGTEVLYVNDNIKDLAQDVSLAISKASGLKNRGAKKRTNLGFLNQTDEKAILIEVCFVDSSKDVELYQASFNAICRAIAETVTGKSLNNKFESIENVIPKIEYNVTKKYSTSELEKIVNSSPYGLIDVPFSGSQRGNHVLAMKVAMSKLGFGYHFKQYGVNNDFNQETYDGLRAVQWHLKDKKGFDVELNGVFDSKTRKVMIKLLEERRIALTAQKYKVSVDGKYIGTYTDDADILKIVVNALKDKRGKIEIEEV